MRREINNIINSWNSIVVLKKEIFDKENQVLSCINLLEKSISIDKKNISLKQKNTANTILNLDKNLCKKIFNLGKLLKKLDKDSFNKEKISSNLRNSCFYSGIDSESYNKLKFIFKSFHENKYKDTLENQKFNRVNKTYFSYLKNLR